MNTSVVLSTYNGRKFIIPQLESIRKQVRQPDEVLIFDDRSTDDTVELVKKYIDEHKLNNSWTILVNSENKGWRRNFIEGIWKSSGEIVFTCDQDDIWRSDKIKVMAGLMEEHSEIDLLTSNYAEFNDQETKKPGPWKNDKQLKKLELRQNYLLVQSPGCTHCISRRLANLSKKYWEPDYPHDALLWRLAGFNNALYIYTDALIKWRKHNTSAFSKESKDLKTIGHKKDWIVVAKRFNQTLRQFLGEDVNTSTSRQAKLLKRSTRWLNVRTRFYESRSILTGIKLAFYLDCFPRYRQYLGDWYLLFIKRK